LYREVANDEPVTSLLNVFRLFSARLASDVDEAPPLLSHSCTTPHLA